MSHWNYRVVRRTYPPAKDGTVEHILGIHEAYYHDHESEPFTITEERMDPHGETLEELRSDLANMLKALDAPVLEYDEIGRDKPAASGGRDGVE